MKTKLLSLLLVTMFGLIACTVDDNPVGPSEPDGPSIKELDYSSVKCDAPVFVSYNLVPEVRAAVETYLTNITSIEEATVAVVKSEDIPVYEKQLVDLYNRGGLIVLARPTFENVDKFAEKYAICQQLPTDASQSVMLFAFDNTPNCFVLFGDGPQDNTAAEAEEVEEIVPDEPVNEESGPDPEVEDEQTYNKRRIFEFFRWVKNERAKKVATRGTTWVTPYDPYLLFRESQHITHNYDMSLKHKMVKVAGCKADYLDVKGSIEVHYDIFAAYVYEGSANAGDYYIIKRSLIVHNDDFYDGYSKTHGGVKVWLGGFFMKQVNLQSKLLYGNNDLKGALFASEVTPATTISSSSYNTGFNLGLDGALSIGTESGVSCGFGASYSSETTTTISDLEIQKETKNDNRQVGHIYTVKNIPNKWTAIPIMAWQGISALTNQIPAIACADFDTISEWAWEVPAGTNDVADNKDTKFSIYTDFKFDYGALVYSTFAFYNSDKSYSRKGSCTQSIAPPMRVPFGVLSLKNAHPNAIARISIWEQKPNSVKGDSITTLPSSYAKGETAKYALSEGTYCIEYDHVNKSNNEVINSWKIENVKIQRGASEGVATTEVSTTDAVER